MGSGRLRALVQYGRKVYDLRQRLGAVRDRRRAPRTPASQVAAAVFCTGLLRIRSFNALEPRLSEKSFLCLVGASAEVRRLCSADTLGRALRGMDLESVRRLVTGMVAQAERNKAFREGWFGALRYVGLDGWESIQSFHRHCDSCLVRHLKLKGRHGEILVEQYYHRYVVAMLLDRRLDLMLDFEPVLPQALRAPGLGPADTDEGELTAARRLLWRVKRTYSWVDVVVGDALYANGPFLSLVQDLRMGAVVIARKETDEPLREALALWQGRPAEQIIEDQETHERIELWDCKDLRMLATYSGTIRVVRGCVQGLGSESAAARRTWCMLVTGRATRLSPKQVLSVGRSRWHIENTGFHQWSTRWRFAHVFTHDGHGIQALYWLFFAAYNLLTLFLYLKLQSYGRDRGKDRTRTISRLVDEMNDDLARLKEPLWDTS